MPEAYILLTPLLVLPIYLLLVVFGCAEILGIEEGVPAPPETGTPPVTFTYAANLPGPPPGVKVNRIAWGFDAQALEYPAGESLPMGFQTGPFERGDPSPTPILPGGETVNHGDVGQPSGGVLTCEVRVWIGMDQQPSIVQSVSKGPGDTDFPDFDLSHDLVFT